MASIRRKPDVFQKILKNASNAGITKGTEEARDWFREAAKDVSWVNSGNLVNNSRKTPANTIMPGFMYMFLYDAKHKETLPYYDKFPLIFPLEKYDDGFLGINLHYLPHMYRARLMDALYALANNKNFDEKTRLRISYKILKKAARFRYFKPCVKRYLFSQLRSRYIMIPSNELDIALFLPLERFTVKKARVQRDSVNSLVKKAK